MFKNIKKYTLYIHKDRHKTGRLVLVQSAWCKKSFSEKEAEGEGEGEGGAEWGGS